MKKIATILLGIVISVMIFSNIWTQFNTLKEARKQNYDMEQKISKLDEENQILSQKIAYATSSAFLEGEARDKLGLGKENDIWVLTRNRTKDDTYEDYMFTQSKGAFVTLTGDGQVNIHEEK